MQTTTAEFRVSRVNETPGSYAMNVPAMALQYWREKIATAPWYDAEREQCVSIMLNTRMYALGHYLVGIGTLNKCIAYPRDIFRAAIAINAYGVLFMHNHPSGDVTPSDADHRLTRKIAESGRILQITFYDHIIVPTGPAPETSFPRDYFSMRESGVL